MNQNIQALSVNIEDNNDAIELAKAPKIHPRTKNIDLKYHPFREHVWKGLIEINTIDTIEQVTYIFTKGLPFPIFIYQKRNIMGMLGCRC